MTSVFLRCHLVCTLGGAMCSPLSRYPPTTSVWQAASQHWHYHFDCSQLVAGHPHPCNFIHTIHIYKLLPPSSCYTPWRSTHPSSQSHPRWSERPPETQAEATYLLFLAVQPGCPASLPAPSINRPASRPWCRDSPSGQTLVLSGRGRLWWTPLHCMRQAFLP